jgi:hypothetical protein
MDFNSFNFVQLATESEKTEEEQNKTKENGEKEEKRFEIYFKMIEGRPNYSQIRGNKQFILSYFKY